LWWDEKSHLAELSFVTLIRMAKKSKEHNGDCIQQQKSARQVSRIYQKYLSINNANVSLDPIRQNSLRKYKKYFGKK